MRLIDADELTEMVWRERLDTRERIANLIARQPTITRSVKQCKMIPLEPDCRGYTNVFICTNCQLHIHLGFISQRYGGNFCVECGAEVEDGEAE
jgi:hypothetical protein